MTVVDWFQARQALADVTGRVTALLRTIDDPSPQALGQWNVAEVAAHLSHPFDVLARLAAGRLDSPLGELPELDGTTTRLVDDDPERDLGALADRIDARSAAFLQATAGTDPDELIPWLVKGTCVGLRTLTCHLLNEAVVHGHDIATASGRPWPIERSHAALILDGFLIPMARDLDPRTLVDQRTAAGGAPATTSGSEAEGDTRSASTTAR